MIAAAAVCPSPPLLARELAGRALVLPELREACATAIARLLQAAPGVVIVVGGGPATAAWDPGGRLDLSAWAPALGGHGTPRLPLALGLGAMLLDEAGYAGPRILQAVGEAEPPQACLRLGASLAAANRAALLVIGDGTARRSPAAPGHFDPRAEPFDHAAEQALRDGDMAALAKLDAALAADLMATGRAAWQVLAGALGGGPAPAGEVLYAGAPFGVGYFVALLGTALYRTTGGASMTGMTSRPACRIGSWAMNDDPAVLLTAPGPELLARLAAAGDEAAGDLALAVSLRREYPASLVAAATAQHQLRLAARVKFRLAMEMLFTRGGYEQSSSEPVARHRAERFAGIRRAADLCCGIGGDLVALAAGREVLAVDRDAAHARLAVHNAGVYGLAAGVRACVADVRDVRLAGIDAIFIDPARRPGTPGGTRRFPAGVSQPPLGWCVALAGRVPAVCVKAAPGLPAELIPAGWEAEFIADGRDLKEAALWSPDRATTSRRATILPGGDTLAASPGEPVPVGEPGEYLLDPSPAVTRAGLVAELARAVGGWQLDPRIAFLAAKREVTTPFARTLRVVESAPWNEKRFARRLRELGVGAADLRRRGLAGDVDQIRRRLRLAGPHRATVVLTRAGGKPWGLICADPGSPLG